MKHETYEFLKSAATDASVFNENMKHYNILTRVNNLIQEAWEEWDDEQTKDFWEGDVKPAHRTKSFAEHWIDSEDFEADGFDEDELDSIVPEYYFK